MKRWKKTGLAAVMAVCFLGMGTTEFTVLANQVPEVKIGGDVIYKTDHTVVIDNCIQEGFEGEFLIHISENTRLLNAETGMPASLENVKDGEPVHAYVGAAVTASIPPQAEAEVLLIDIPTDGSTVDYVKISSIQNKEEGYQLTGTKGQNYWIEDSCNIFPYLTRNKIYLETLYEGAECIIWGDKSGKAEKIMMFPPYGTEEMEAQEGWVLESENAETSNAVWIYIKKDGSRHKGWLEDKGKWYYLNPETGVMERGFLQVDGKTYYLLEDGSMLTDSRQFTPDKDGVLR